MKALKQSSYLYHQQKVVAASMQQEYYPASAEKSEIGPFMKSPMRSPLMDQALLEASDGNASKSTTSRKVRILHFAAAHVALSAQAQNRRVFAPPECAYAL